MENGFLLILVGFIGVIVGFALGMGVASLRATPPKVKKPALRSAPKPVARSAAKPTAQSAPQPSPESAAAVSPSRPAGPPVETPANALQSPSKAAEGMPQVDLPPDLSAQPGGARRPSLTPIDVISRALQADVRAPDTASKSIAAQVDEILQEMLKKSPLAARAIKLMELPGKGMVVMVGLNQYDGVDAVPDEDIRRLIRSAVAEWERQATQSAP